MKKAIVFGGNGFIGSHVVDLLDRLGYDVTVFDRFSREPTYSAPARAIQGDFHDAAQVSAALAGMDEVFHFLTSSTAASRGVNAPDDLASNVLPAVRLAQSAADHGVRRFVFASTGGAIYSSATPGPYKETDDLAPISAYGTGKLCIETYLDLICSQSSMQSLVLRIANPYGTRQRPDRLQGVIPIALRRVLDGQPLTRMGDGSMVRDYIWMDDLLERLARLLEAPAPRNRVYNLGSGTGNTVNDVFEGIAQVTGIRPVIETVPQPASYVQSVTLDMSRFDDEFGTLPNSTSLEAGITKLWEEINDGE
ncbi:NAD-dependent epimerase/dehydratase family protein [Zhihengliuella halotolerans]|uniref:UDP-glucose 4-epimerase n=1 Tax=Zhihengliuella halotolerans TaxID=370736 RepID=A0A4Q8AB82_9MICC|nr:NAD-dependent epimerase/dehydratase family protein [Zhihengliuella halotolerans]RZU60825.1 UDP-glucose 4-epimerase [Zhihengliuella halotolerans]